MLNGKSDCSSFVFPLPCQERIKSKPILRKSGSLLPSIMDESTAGQIYRPPKACTDMLSQISSPWLRVIDLGYSDLWSSMISLS